MRHWLDAWHKSKIGLLICVIVDLAICYGFASIAIDRGNLWWYLLTLIFLFASLQYAVKLIQLLVRKEPTRAKHR